MEMTLVGGRGLSHLRCLGSLEEMPLRNQVEGRGLGALGGTSGLLGGADTMVTPICPRRMVATSPQGGLARLPTGWVGGWGEVDGPVLVLEAGAGEPCSFQTTDASSFQTLSSPSAVSLAPLPVPTTYPTPMQEAF